MSKLLFYIFFIFLSFLAIKRRHVKTDYPKLEICMIFFGLFTSMFVALIFHGQSLKDSAIAMIPNFFAYAFFPVLMQLQIPVEKILQSVKVFVISGMIVYIAKYVTFPNMIFGVLKDEYDMSRGIVRLGVPFLFFFVLLMFRYINQWVLIGKRKCFIWIFLTAAFILLNVTRQHIVFSSIFALLLVLQNASMQKKIFTIGACLIVVFVILPQIPLVNAMVKLSNDQVYSNAHEDEDIRVKDYKYFIIEGQSNRISPLFGNGLPRLGKTKWGIEEEKKHSRLNGGDGIYQADVGWAGFFWYYGIVALLGLLFLLIKAIKKKKNKNEIYLNYWLLFILFISMASGPLIYYDQFLCISIVLYLIYAKRNFAFIRYNKTKSTVI